jgi:phosphatidylglycerol lysyltransferase
VARHQSLRAQFRRAAAKGVTVRQLTVTELEGGPTRDAMTSVAERWLATREMAPMGFLVNHELFAFPGHRRCFVAEAEGRVVGFAAIVPVPARNGWFIEDLIRSEEAPNGTAELLVDAVMRWAASADCGWLTLGMTPLAGDVAGALRLARRSTTLLYDFTGLRAFKAKLRPNEWLAVHLAFPTTQGAIASIVDVLAAFARGGFVSFGLRSLLRGPTAVLRALALLLVIWTILLALAPAQRWFAAPWMKWGWVVFDVLVAVGLFRLLRRPRRTLATALALAVTADALLTLVEALSWNVPRASSPLDGLVIVLACAAPLLGAVVLWGARLKTRAA